jgi:trypsin-like peptidase
VTSSLIRWVSLLLVLMACSLEGAHAQGGTPSPSLSTERIAAKAIPATVTIVTLGVNGDTLGAGSGFLVRSNGVIITNFHVMAGASKAVVILSTGETYEQVEALDTDKSADIALLKIPGYGLPTLPTTATLPPVGARVVAVGNPLGLSRTVTEGIVSAVRLFEGRQILQMSAAISAGSSGGPVLNARGAVVAVARSYLESGQNLNFAVPVRYAMGLVGGGQPVALAEVFGVVGARSPVQPPVSAAGPTDTRLPAGGNERPSPPVTPRTSVVGAYAVVQETWVTKHGKLSDEPMETFGLLLLGARDNGFYLSIMDTTEASKTVFWLSSLTARPDGRLVTELGGMTWTGYQTDDGIFLESSYPPGAEREGATIWLRGKSVDINLSTLNGLYDLQVRTAYTIDGDHSGYTDWTGEAAIVTARDSIFIDSWLENKDGGDVGFYAAGPLGEEGTFDLTSKSGKRLTGHISSGRLSGEWVDPRSKGQFRGVLDGRHR